VTRPDWPANAVVHSGAVGDPRVEEYARLLVEKCVDVQPGWEVLVLSSVLGRPLHEAVVRQIARRGAYALPRLVYSFPGNIPWILEAPEDLVRNLAPIDAHVYENIDGLIQILAPENTREGSEIAPERLALFRKALRDHRERMFTRELSWVVCQFPSQALAQDAGMTLPEFEDFLFGTVLVDWDELTRTMTRIAERFDAASTVRVVASGGTDVTFSLEGRRGQIDALSSNVPGGEVFYSPVEDSAEGVLALEEYPACYVGHVVDGVRLRFERGEVVEASARSDERFLLTTLATDDGARRLGEFGFGSNPGITRYMRNALFDRKMEGTVHFVFGNGYPFLGGTNVSAIHWEMVKDLRRGGQIFADGELVQENGRWLLDG
jgi:aminopeptidase